MSGDFWISGPYLADADEHGTVGALDRSVRALLDRDPDFIPNPQQINRYRRMRLSPDLLKDLLARAGLVVCPACKGPGCDACRGRGHVTELFADSWERQGT